MLPSETTEKIIGEIIQIKSQYQAEVGRGRKAWPKAIKDRVTELFKAGMKATDISKATGMSYFMVLRWRPEGYKKGAPRGVYAQKFKELVVAAHPKNLATVTVPKAQVKEVATVTVTTPLGYKIEGNSHDVMLILQSVRGL